MRKKRCKTEGQDAAGIMRSQQPPQGWSWEQEQISGMCSLPAAREGVGNVCGAGGE